MKIIIAGNAKQYLQYLKENKLQIKDAHYACKREDILGYRNVEVIYYGTGAIDNPLAGDPYLKLIQKKDWFDVTYPYIFQNKLMWFLWKKFLCKSGFHLFDEVSSGASVNHYLYCDACELRINIE